MTEKYNIELGLIQKTLLLPLWGRAVETRKKNHYWSTLPLSRYSPGSIMIFPS